MSNAKKTATQSDYNRKSLQRLGKKQVAFILTADELARLEHLCQHTGQRRIDVLRHSLAAYERELGIATPASF